MWPFSQARGKPAIIPTDTVIPLHFWDDHPVSRAVVMDSTLRFDDVLDPDRIRNTLVRLMELGNWRKLGARLRMNDAGKLEYHVPARYDDERPGFSYTHVEYDIRIEDHSLASQLPRASNRPSVQASLEKFRSLCRRPDAPKRLDDYLFSDEPQLSLHIVSFEDSTLLSLTWLHAFVDAMGVALFSAWTQVLNGQEDQVPPLHGFETDPLATLGCSTVEKSVLASRMITGLSMLVFIFRLIFELLWWRKEDSRTVCLPASYLQAIKQTAMQELGTHNQGDYKPFVSDGDLVCSWWTRLALQHLGPTSNRTVTILNMHGLRGVLAQDLLPAGTAYVSNAPSGIYTILPAWMIFQRPISFLASQLRQSIQEQSTRSQVEAFAALARNSILNGPVFGDASTQMIMFSNWTKAKYYEIDLSSVVTKQGVPPEKRTNALGRPSYLHSSAHLNGFPTRYAFAIFGKDAAGNYWLGGTLRALTWKKIEEDFAAIYVEGAQ